MKIAIFGATSAIAQAVAKRYAERGDSLYLVGRNEHNLAAVATDLTVISSAFNRSDDQILIVKEAIDLVDTHQHKDLVQRAVSTLKGLDMALIAHGVLPQQEELEENTAKLLDSFQTNLLSPISLMNELATYFKAEQAGVLAVIGSVAGDRGRQSNYAYGAAKAGLSTFAEGLRHRLINSGVRVLLIKPGFVKSPMTAHLPQKGLLWSTPEKIAKKIVAAMEYKNATIYVPGFWRGIMAIIKALPGKILFRTKL